MKTYVRGVSAETRPNGTVRLVWRNRVDPTTGFPVRQKRGWTLHVDARPSEIREAAFVVGQALESQGYFVAPTTDAAAARVHGSWLAQEGIDSFLADERARGLTPGSLGNLAISMKYIVLTARKALSLGEDTALRGPALFNPDTFRDVINLWRTEGRPGGRGPYSETTIERHSRTWLACWASLRDEPHRWPDIQTGALRAKRIKPQAPQRAARPAPTLASMDAAVRSMLSTLSPYSEVVAACRTLGLRPTQAVEIRVEHVDVSDALVFLDAGYERSTKRYPRRIPVPRWWADSIAYRVQALPRDAYLFAKLSTPQQIPTVGAHTLSDLLEQGERWGAVDPTTWRAVGTFHKRRLWTWFRAGYQRHLEDAGVPEKAIDVLVGHKGKTVRARNYNPARDPELRDAVAKVPPIDWGVLDGRLVRAVEWGQPRW